MIAGGAKYLVAPRADLHWSTNATLWNNQAMSDWPARKARRVFAALLRIGWRVKRQTGSHKTLERSGRPDFVWAFHDGEEIGPGMLARIAKATGLSPRDL